jgi:uncharacterized RDD family membrane protein YckC
MQSPAVTVPEKRETQIQKKLVEYAGFWRRFFALLIDSIIIGILAAVVSFIVDASIYLNYLVTFLVAVLYFSFGFWGKAKGQTIGKRFLGLQVVDLSGRGPNYGRALLRSLPIAILLVSLQVGDLPQVGYPLSILINISDYAIAIFVSLSILITVILHPQKRGIHDMLAGTLCIRFTPAPQPVIPIKVGTRLRIGLIAIAIMSLAVGTVVAMPFAPEHPLITSWRDEGLVRGAQFLSHSWRVTRPTGSAAFNALEVKAVVSSCTIADEAKVRNIENRLSRDITFGREVDIIVIKLVENKKFGFFDTSKCCWKLYPVSGKDRIFNEAREVARMFIKCD